MLRKLFLLKWCHAGKYILFLQSERMGNSSCLKRLFYRWKQLGPQLNLFSVRLEQGWMSDGMTRFLRVPVQESPSVSAVPPLSPACSTCDCVYVEYSQKTEGRNSWAKGQVKTAKVLLWQKKLKCTVLFLLETEPRTKKALNERLKLAGRADTFFNIVVNPCMYWKMLIGKEKSEKQAFSSSIISRKIRIMRGAALRVESKHEETRQSNANMCKALQKQRGR